MPRSSSRKAQLREYLQARQPARINGAVWEELLAALAPISENYLRRLLRDTGLPFDQPWAGVRQESFETLEQSLLEMERIYSEGMESGDRAKAQVCRNAVIQAKDHARLSLKKAEPEKQARKQEMIQWMLVWLENPGVFPAWVALRKQRM